MSKKNEHELYDMRLLNYNIKMGFITDKDYESFLKSLKNNESNAEYIEIPDEEESTLTFEPVNNS